MNEYSSIKDARFDQRSSDMSEKKYFPNNQWTAPDCHFLSTRKQIQFFVNGHGGDLDQSWLYFDPEGAANWLHLTESSFYNPLRNLDFSLLTDVIYFHWKRSQFNTQRMHILGLGCGNAYHEIRLVKRILQRFPEMNISLYLLDLSAFLLNDAYHLATAAFANEPRVQVSTIEGNFESLSIYHPIIQLARESNELIILPMFGATFGNLPNERLLVKNALRVFPKHTLFLVDVVLSTIPTNDPELIKKQDPRLSGKESWFCTPEQINFLIQPIKQHRTDLEDISLRWELDYTTCFEGSYSIEIQGKVNHQIDFTVMRVKRYEPTPLANMLRQGGWEPVQGFPYGFEQDSRMLYLLSRM